MVGSSKILTVSYGTFSCTLEGFDDSFSTMKAIAEYFRDLAADDRYFGAEPPTPDAEMLARIAEREVTHRVEAHTGDNGSGVVLKAASALAAPEIAKPEVAADTNAASSTIEASSVSVEPTMPPAAEAPTSPVNFSGSTSVGADTYEEDEEPVSISSRATVSDSSETGHPDADSVAAKLQRIRAVVSRSATPAPQETPDTALFDDADVDTVSEDDSEDDNDALTMSLSDMMADESDDIDGLATDEVEAEADDTFDEDIVTPEEEVSETDVEEPTPVRARVIRMARNETEETDADIAASSDNDMADEADDVAEAIENEALVEDDFGTTFDDLGQSAEVEQEAIDTEELEKLDGDALAEAALSTLNPDAEADLQAELAALNGGEDLYPDAQPLRLDTPISDAVDQIAETTEEAAVPDTPQDTPTDVDAADMRPRRVKLPGGPDDADSAMTRIMSETEAQLAAPETSRRRDAIAQLKAAVAATEAERGAGDKSGSDDNNDEASFRDDLRQVVRPARPIRPSRPIEPTSERAEPAPLKLVASQRVDEEMDAAEVPMEQPAEVAAEAAPVADLSSVSEATGFEAFAQQMGAQDLSDLLEAAAAYTSFVEGAEDFSRPQLMSKVKEMSGAEYSREEGLRAFGTLLRQGQISKVRNGRFQVSDDTRFHPERRAG